MSPAIGTGPSIAPWALVQKTHLWILRFLGEFVLGNGVSSPKVLRCPVTPKTLVVRTWDCDFEAAARRTLNSRCPDATHGTAIGLPTH